MTLAWWCLYRYNTKDTIHEIDNWWTGLDWNFKILFCRRQHQENEKTGYQLGDTSDKGLLPKTYKDLLKLNIKKTNNLIKREGKDLNRLLLRRYTAGKEAYEKVLYIICYQGKAN